VGESAGISTWIGMEVLALVTSASKSTTAAG